MKLEKINFVLLLVGVVGILYMVFYQPTQQKAKIKQCFDTAVALEKARHNPADDLTVSNQDISSFQKNVLACMAN
jgi:hypothetical protein